MKTNKQIFVENMCASVNRAMKSLKTIKESLQQLKHKAALRIPPPQESAIADQKLRAALEQLHAISADFARFTQAAGKPDDKETRESLRSYADLGTGWWRIWRKTLRPGTDRPLDEMKGIFSFVESLKDVLDEMGIQVIDHTGKEIQSGLSLEVLEYQEKPGITKERVSETVRPTVYYKSRLVQMGRVYVDSPMTATRSVSQSSTS
jgi:hypothetical protein